MNSFFTQFQRRNFVGPFQPVLRCYSVAVLSRPELECSGKIILPPSALHHLTQLQIDYPMLFCIQNPQNAMKTFCGVLEFIAEEGRCYLPYWIMNQLNIIEGGTVRITNATLQKGEFVRIQPHTSDFLDITNPRAVLEMAFRSYSTLTVGDTIKVEYNSKIYLIDILEVKPENINNSITIVEADVQVDFAPPIDYVEPSYTNNNNNINEKDIDNTQNEIIKDKKEEQDEENQEIQDSFIPFTGNYNTLHGGPPRVLTRESLTKSAPAQSSPKIVPKKETKEELVFKTRELRKSTSSTTKRKRRKRGDPINSEEDNKEPEKPKIVPFSGKGYSLRSK